MNDSLLRTTLRELADDLAPSSSIDLLPDITARLSKPQSFTTSAGHREDKIMNPSTKNLTRRLAMAMAALVLVAGIVLAATPFGRAFAADIIQLFTRAESNTIAPQDYSLAQPAPAGADPASILDANASIAQVASQVDFQIRIPVWTPEDLPFNAASLDEGARISRLFYGQAEGNSLILRQEKNASSDACDLCGKVGADADIQVTSVNGAHAEYAQGVWNLTENGAVWTPDPWLQTLRWQADGMAYELMFMGQPDAMNLDTLVKVAESMK